MRLRLVADRPVEHGEVARAIDAIAVGEFAIDAERQFLPLVRVPRHDNAWADADDLGFRRSADAKRQAADARACMAPAAARFGIEDCILQNIRNDAEFGIGQFGVPAANRFRLAPLDRGEGHVEGAGRHLRRLFCFEGCAGDRLGDGVGYTPHLHKAIDEQAERRLRPARRQSGAGSFIKLTRGNLHLATLPKVDRPPTVPLIRRSSSTGSLSYSA